MKTIISFITIALLSIQWVNANENKPVNLQDIVNKNAGNVIYLDFWASWCVPCRRSFPWMNQMQQKYGNQGFKVISINLDAEKPLTLKGVL
jgi:thiol-disulfide isomerase/thioredoxin